MTVSAPLLEELEVSVFSRGYGESVLIHAGQNHWIIIDTLLDVSHEPAPLAYLDQIGVDCSKDVVAILLTHWHDDHVTGAGKVVDRCETATVALSGALLKDEFKAFLRAATVADTQGFSSGVGQLIEVLTILQARGRQAKWCWADLTISARHGETPYQFEALSPSHADFERLLRSIQKWDVPSPNPVRRLPSPPRNDVSVATAFVSRNESCLFGADLEIMAGAGWQLIHEMVWGDRPKASLYKVAHHGSPTGHYLQKWADMLTEDVVAVLTPWNRGRKLPQETDIERILSHTDRAYSAAKMRQRRSAKRMNAVERSIREAGIQLMAMNETVGQIIFRKRAGEQWRVHGMLGDACHLRDFTK